MNSESINNYSEIVNNYLKYNRSLFFKCNFNDIFIMLFKHDKIAVHMYDKNVLIVQYKFDNFDEAYETYQKMIFEKLNEEAEATKNKNDDLKK